MAWLPTALSTGPQHPKPQRPPSYLEMHPLGAHEPTGFALDTGFAQACAQVSGINLPGELAVLSVVDGEPHE